LLVSPGFIALKTGASGICRIPPVKSYRKNKYTNLSLIANGPVVTYNDKLMGFARRDGSVVARPRLQRISNGQAKDTYTLDKTTR